MYVVHGIVGGGPRALGKHGFWVRVEKFGVFTSVFLGAHCWGNPEFSLPYFWVRVGAVSRADSHGVENGLLATTSSVVGARGVAVLFVQEGKTGLLTPIGVVSERSLLIGRVDVVARREKEKYIISSLDLLCYNVQV